MTEKSQATNVAAYNMAHSQLVTQGVQDKAIVGAICSVPWQHLLPESMTAIAYSDSAIHCGEGVTLPPTEIGKTLALLSPAADKELLIIGGALGAEAYAAHALFAGVTVVEQDAQTLDVLRLKLPDAVKLTQRSPLDGNLPDREYHAILFNSALPLQTPPSLPDALLADEGAVVYFTTAKRAGLVTAWKAIKMPGTAPVFYPDFQYSVNPEILR